MITPGFYTYWLTARDPRTNTVIWDGMLLAQEITDDGEKVGLKPHNIPEDLAHALASVPTYVTEWEPVWEVIDDDKDKDKDSDGIT